MKRIYLKWLQRIILILLLATNCKANSSNNFLFLNYEQFAHLTSPEQNRYIESLQKLVLQFEESESSSRKNIFSKSLFIFSSLLRSASAAQEVLSKKTESSRIRSTDIEEENLRIGNMLVFIGAYTRAGKDLRSPVIKSTAKETLQDTYDRLQILSNRSMTAEQKKNFDMNVSTLKEKYAVLAQVIPEVRNDKMEISKLDLKTQTARTTSSIIKTSPALKSTAGPVCLYAGFVISTPSCSPLKSLATELQLQEIGSAEFKCKSNNEILCNPLVFGYQSDLSPYCTTRSKSASMNCQEISNNTENSARIQAAWKNPANKKVFEDFQNSLQQLCDTDNKSSDVRATCKVVVAQFNEKVKKEFPTHMTAQKIESMNSNQSAAKK